MTDERAESLAAQAASWVPPWERAAREPDREFQAAAAAADDDGETVVEPTAGDEPGEDESGLGGDDDDFDPAFEGADPVGAEVPALAGDDDELPAVVDEPQDVVEESGDLAGVVEVAEPAAIRDAEGADAATVDAPVDGDDAGDVFERAADDDLSDDAEMELPFAEEVPVGDAPDEDDDGEPAAAVEEEADGPEIPLLGPDATGGAAEPKTRSGGSGIPVQQRGIGGQAGAGGGTSERTEEESAPLPDAELRAALEAILLVVDEPVGELQLAQIMEEPAERIAGMLDDISARYTAAGHGFDLRRAAGGWRLYTRPEYAAYVERFVLDGQSVRLTQAALETVAVVAYKQPVTRSRISAIRGVNCDGVMRTLVTRGLIEECGTEGETGAFLYRTTPLFLEKLGLNSVDQLPPLAPFLPDDVEEVLDASG